MADKNDAGFDAIPARYATEGREAIDIIRETLGDTAFVAFCRGTALKYRLREGKKAGAENDGEKARWYETMANHVLYGSVNPEIYPDPRTYRRKNADGT